MKNTKNDKEAEAPLVSPEALVRAPVPFPELPSPMMGEGAVATLGNSFLVSHNLIIEETMD